MPSPRLFHYGNFANSTPAAPIIVTSINNLPACAACYDYTITGEMGSNIWYNIGPLVYPDPSCNDLSGYSIDAMSNNFSSTICPGSTASYIRAVACLNGVSSPVSISDPLTGYSCLSLISDPEITYSELNSYTVQFTVNANSCGITYITFGIGTSETIADPTSSNYQAIIYQNATSSPSSYTGYINGDFLGTLQVIYTIKAVTDYGGVTGNFIDCPSLSSNIVVVSDCCISKNP